MTEGFLKRPRPGVLALIGEDAAEFLQGQVTNDIQALQPGEGAYAALLTPKGKVRADMRILRTADNLLVVCDSALLPTIRHTIDTYRIGYFFKTEDMSEYWSLLSLVSEDPDLMLHDVGIEGEDALGWNENDNVVVDINGTLAIRTPIGIDLLGADSAIEQNEALIAAAHQPIDEAAADAARVEAGIPAFGRDFTEDNIPQEANLNERAVSFEKGCYVGQETVARLHYKGSPNRSLRLLQAEQPLQSGTTVTAADGKELGTVGTAVASERLGHVALAVLRREAETGATVDAGGVSATVADPPQLPQS